MTYTTETFLVFVYGSLKHGFGNHDFLRTAEFLGKTQTVEKYDMVPCCTFPGVVKNRKTHKIEGELYRVDADTLLRLDELEGNGILYQREEIAVEGIKRPVWMYFLIHAHHATYMSDFIEIDGDTKRWVRDLVIGNEYKRRFLT